MRYAVQSRHRNRDAYYPEDIRDRMNKKKLRCRKIEIEKKIKKGRERKKVQFKQENTKARTETRKRMRIFWQIAGLHANARGVEQR